MKAVGGAFHLEAFALEGVLNDQCQGGLVLYEQDAGVVFIFQYTGILSVNTEPPPGRGAYVMRPP